MFSYTESIEKSIVIGDVMIMLKNVDVITINRKNETVRFDFFGTDKHINVSFKGLVDYETLRKELFQ